MIGEFSNNFLNFARSVDIVDELIWEKSMNIFKDFLSANKVVRSAGYLIRGFRNLGSGPDWCLHSIWWAQGQDFKGAEFSQYLKELDAGHTNYSFTTKKPIWVVSKSKKPLHEDTDYVNLLDNLDNSAHIPPFKLHPVEQPYVKTSVCYPDKLGVLNLELKEYVTPEQGWRESVQELADAVHLLYRAYMFRKRSKENSLSMLDHLKKFATVSPHTYFISYAHENSHVADQVEVILRRKTRHVRRDEHFMGGGDILDEKIMNEINESDTFLGLWSNDYEKSKYCKSELRYASERKMNNNHPHRIVLLTLDEVEPKNTSLGTTLYLPGQGRDKVETSMNRILENKEEEKKD